MLLNHFSQGVLTISSTCHLSCVGCKIGEQKSSKDDQKLSKLIAFAQKNTFFDQFPLKKQYHITGGDFIGLSKLPVLLKYFKDKGIYTVLWTHGALDAEIFQDLLPFVDKVMVYIPCPDPVRYRKITFIEGWEQTLDLMTCFKEEKQDFGLNFKVTPLNFSFLPDIYDLAFNHQKTLLLHYNQTEAFSSDILKYINRFKWVKGVDVYKTKLNHARFCHGFPYGALTNKVQAGSTLCYAGINSLRKKIGL